MNIVCPEGVRKEEWDKLDDRVCEWFYNIYKDNITAENFLEFTLSINQGIECKLDIMAKKTGNFYVEYECSKKPSGIFREEDLRLEYWAHSDGEFVYLVPGNDLKDFVRNIVNGTIKVKDVRTIAGGDGRRTKGILIPIATMDELSEYKFKL